MRAILLTILFTLMTTASTFAQSNVGGKYQVIGKNLDGSGYSGTAEIVVISANTCRITWVTGRTKSTGICMRNGSTFSAAYRLGDKVGLVIYDILEDGSMEGLWTIADQTGVGVDRLIPIH